MKKYIILELIPTASTKEKGDIIQLSAIKLNELTLIDRFDYRITDDKIPLTNLKEMINKKCKIFISISNETKLFLLKNGLIDKDIVDIYEMKTVVNEKKEMVNLYQLNKKDIDNNEKVNEIKATKLFIAKENGLNNKLFLRSLEILNEITKKRKIFLNVDKIARTCNNFAINKSDLILKLKSYCEKELVDSSKKDFTSECALLESMNKIFN